MAERAGFSLIETLVALAVFGLAALALVNLTTESVRAASRVEARLLAGIVADNLLVEALAAPDAPAPGESEGVRRIAGRDWPWRRSVQGADAGLIRIEVRVLDGADVAASETAFRGAS